MSWYRITAVHFFSLTQRSKFDNYLAANDIHGKPSSKIIFRLMKITWQSHEYALIIQVLDNMDIFLDNLPNGLD